MATFVSRVVSAILHALQLSFFMLWEVNPRGWVAWLGSVGLAG